MSILQLICFNSVHNLTMFKSVKHSLFLLLLIPVLCFTSIAQKPTVRGVVWDVESNETVIGARVFIKGKTEGTITESDGTFRFSTREKIPFTLVFAAYGFEPEEVEVRRSGIHLGVGLEPEQGAEKIQVQTTKVENEVLSVSKILERRLEAPTFVQKLGLMAISTLPGLDVYSGIDGMQEVQMNLSSHSFISLNTRGFTDLQNRRFLQLLDGVDMSAPGLSYSLGNLVGAHDLDFHQIEIVAGPGSALYGPNFFNGALIMNTRNPFDYEGLSAQLKLGFTNQQAGGTNPYYDGGIRFAKKIGERFAFKINASYERAYDWVADDDRYHITNENAIFRNILEAFPRDHPNYDAVNTYGDEAQVRIELSNGVGRPINRSGIREQDIVDYNVSNIRFNTALHYKISPSVQAIYDYKFVEGDAILRHSAVTPLVNIQTQIHRLEVKGDVFWVRAYHTMEDAGDSYQMMATGDFIQSGLKSDVLWGADYKAAFEGEIPGISAGDDGAAREYADRNIPGPSSQAFQELLAQSLANPDINTGGSKFIDKSSFLHTDVNYDFRNLFSVVGLVVGGNYRRSLLNSEGSVFNDGTSGFNAPIPVHEWGGYMQLSKKVLQNRVNLRASLRYDEHQNFDPRLTPRASMVISLGKYRQHNFRALYQTGFRNPSPQEGYLAQNFGSTILLGGTNDNILNYRETADGNVISGQSIYDNLYTVNSVQVFYAVGDSGVLKDVDLEFLQPESITTIEFGYRGQISKTFGFNAHFFANKYDNLVARFTGFNLTTENSYSIFANLDSSINSYGASAGMEYRFPGNYILSGNYTWLTYDNDSLLRANNPGFLPSFNTPTNRLNLRLSNKDVYKGIGFSLNFRSWSSYLWESPFGQGTIPAKGIFDLVFNYQIPKYNAIIKLGGTNITGNEYRQVYGGPLVGSRYFLSLTFEGFKLN